mgnify:CR=1 FL=1
MQIEVYPSEIEEDNSIITGEDVSNNYFLSFIEVI